MKETFPERDAKAQAEFDERRERRRAAEKDTGRAMLAWFLVFVYVVYSQVAESAPLIF